MTDISAVGECNAGGTVTITIIIIASIVCGMNRTAVIVTSRETMVSITTE